MEEESPSCVIPMLKNSLETIPIHNAHNNEIITDIFKFLKRDDIEKSQIISHQWNNLAIGCAQVLPLRPCKGVSALDISHKERRKLEEIYIEKCIQKENGVITELLDHKDFMYENMDKTDICVEFTYEDNKQIQNLNFIVSLKEIRKIHEEKDTNDLYHYIRYLRHCNFDYINFDHNYWIKNRRHQEKLLSEFLQILFDFNGENLHVHDMQQNISLELLSALNYINLKCYTIDLIYGLETCDKFLSNPELWRFPKNVENIYVGVSGYRNDFMEWLMDARFLKFIEGQKMPDSSHFTLVFKFILYSERLEDMRKFLEELIKLVTETNYSETVIKNFNIEVQTGYEDQDYLPNNEMFRSIPDFFYLPKYSSSNFSKELVEGIYDTHSMIENETVVISVQDKWKVTIAMKKAWKNMSPKPTHKIYLFFYINFEKL